MAPALIARPDQGWTVFDLRLLRAHRLSQLPAAWVRLAEGYDFLVVAPRLTPASTVSPSIAAFRARLAARCA